jgi:hypothetical protein
LDAEPYRASRLVSRLRPGLVRMNLWDTTYGIYWNTFGRRRTYLNHPLGWLGIVDYATYATLVDVRGGINTLVTRDQVRVHLAKDSVDVHGLERGEIQ